MSFLSNKTLNPHIHLLALRMDRQLDQKEKKLQRIYYLAKTRMFNELLSQTTSDQEITAMYPSLPNKIAKAIQKNEEDKKALNADNMDAIILDMDQKSKKEDSNSQEVDRGQESIYRYAKILFDQGKYEESRKTIILLERQDLKDDLWLKATWARLYCQIVLQKEQSKKTVEQLKKKIEELQADDLKYVEKDSKESQKLMKRLYAQKEEFIYLACFAFFNQPKQDDLQKFVDICTSDKSYFSVVQICCPEILRYLTVSVILNKSLQMNRAFDLFKLAEIISRKIITYKDPFIDFIASLYIDFDFECISEKIEQIRTSAREDIFLSQFQAKIIQSCQFLYYKVSCKVYQTISLQQISKFIGKTPQQAQLWILKYIRSTDIQAKIDNISGILISNKNKQSSSEKYAQVIPNISTFINSLSRAIDRD